MEKKPFLFSLRSCFRHTKFKGRIMSVRNGKEKSSWIALKVNWKMHWRRGNIE